MSRIDIYRHPPIPITWNFDGKNTFTAKYNEYTLVVFKGDFCWVWQIFNDEVGIDHAAYHPCLPTSELDAKVKCQRALNNIK